MVQSVIQTSFHAGEWAPALYARVDLAKYHSAAAVLRNFYVDYRGGASSRPGTRYILQTFKDDSPVRLIPFQASSTVGYILEFGDNYIRFFFDGQPIFDDGTAITNVTGDTITADDTVVDIGDWIFVEDVGGVSGINDKYWIVTDIAGLDITVTDLFGNSPSFSGYTSGGGFGVVMIVGTPYAADDLALLKFTQSVDKLFLCHPNYSPAVLQLIESSNWTYNTILFGATIEAPGGLGTTTSNAGNGRYSYVITAVDVNGQESPPSSVVTETINTTAGQVATIHITWTAVTGAQSYNVYRSPESINVSPPAGAALGYLMNVTGVAADDTFTNNSAHNAADFSQAPQIPRNPFLGAGVVSATVTNSGAYTTVPSATIDDAPPGGITATAQPVLGVISAAVVSSGTGFVVGQQFLGSTTKALQFIVRADTVDGSGHVLTVSIVSSGSLLSGSTPGNPITCTKISGGGGVNIQVNATWGVVAVNITSNGTGYPTPPNITFSAGAATADATLENNTAGNPAVPGLHQQRLVLAAKPQAVQTFNMSQTGSYYNFNISRPIQADDAIEGSIVSGQLNEIKSMVSVPTGLVLLTSKANWLVSAGTGAAITPIDIVANAHSYNGTSDVPPIIANFDILFVQSKGSIVRDLTFNFYTQIYTGTDISVLSSHLFYGHTILEWAWAEEPFKVVWVVRDDGIALSLTFLKEQELIGWAHSDTDGLFKSVATVVEEVDFGLTDSIYFVIERVINGNTVKYIEVLETRLFDDDAVNAWCVDAGLRYVGAPATDFSGAEHLAAKDVTGLADGVIIPSFTMPTDGNFTLSTPASVVTVGLPFEPQLKTLPLDIGQPTVQGKRKGINGVTVRVQQTLGLAIGKDFDSTVPMKDLVLGNVGSATNEVVTGLVTADARTIIDPSWDVPGQYCIRQPFPLPVTILGVIPEIEIGDTK